MMQYMDIYQDTYSSEIDLSPDTRRYLQEAAKWAKFISVVGFVYIGLMILGCLSMLLTSTILDDGLGLYSPTMLVVFSVVMVLFTVMPLIYMNRFATKMQLALIKDDVNYLSESFKNLKSHYKFCGIFIVVVAVLYGLAIIGLVVWSSLS